MDEHLTGLSPELIALIRKAAAAHATAAPAPTAEQIKKLSAIFQPTRGRSEAA
ncbi:MAG: hypothetical protein JWO11_3555 [Nocardioides sp.]|nr:hypothetical protein [Nocardioides sp.]